MGLLTRLFGSKDGEENGQSSGPNASTAPATAGKRAEPRPGMPVTADILKTLFPIRNLGGEVLDAFAHERRAEAYAPGAILFRRGEPVDSIYFLLEGIVLMDLGDGTTYEVHANTAKARFPLCGSQQFSATAHAKSEIQVLRVSPKIMSQNVAQVDANRLDLDPAAADIPNEIRGSRLFQAFCQYYQDEALIVPTLPDIAIKLRRAMSQNAEINEVVNIVQMDAAIAAKLVQVANSPLYLSISPVNNCHDAVVRLGLAATRNLVLSYSLKQLFRCKEPYINDLLHDEWKTSLYLSSLCWVLAVENGGVNPQEAQLAGLISDIGAVPFLYFAENFPRDYCTPAEIAKVLPFVRAPVGAFVLRSMDFPPELIEVPLHSEDWFHDSGPNLTLTDIVVLSKLHSYIGTPKMAELPSINSVPAFGKLRHGELSPELSLKVLHDAKDKISESMKLFES